MIGQAQSKNEVSIRLTDERWYHIVEHHEDLAGHAHTVLEIIENPDFIAAGWLDELLAVRRLRNGKHLVVVYREISGADGFVITAYFTRRIARLERRKILWRKPQQST